MSKLLLSLAILLTGNNLLSRMAAALPIAVVTGANKGIGLEIARKICETGTYKTILACRNEILGMKSVEVLHDEGYNCEFQQLDIESETSIQTFADALKSEYGECHLLVNNAAIAFKSSDPTPFHEQTRPTLSTNFYGTLNLINALTPLLRKSTFPSCSPRVINVASQAGSLRILRSKEKRDAFTSPSLDIQGLCSLLDSFEADVKANQHIERGWANSNYGMSKLGVIALTKVLARGEEQSRSVVGSNEHSGGGRIIQYFSCCPGYCATDMSSHGGSKTAEEGARTPFMLATLDEGHPYTGMCGEFFSEESPVVW